MKRVLIISPHFPPVNAPDMQRVRMSLPTFVEAGWDVTVLTVADPTPSAPVEPELSATIPSAVRVVRAHCFSRNWTQWFGFGNVAWRSLPFLFLTGCRLLAGRRHDVVYFSTTMFLVLPFGRIWRWLSGVPYVIDLQDPWVTDYYAKASAPRPPGGWKYKIAHTLGRLLEGWSMRRASHLITVSAAYIHDLRIRHPEMESVPFTELPFGSPDPDLAHLRATLTHRSPILPAGGHRFAFAGAIGPGMVSAVETFLAALAEFRRSNSVVSAHFFGTSYAQAGNGKPVALALAKKHEVLDCVHEQTDRLPYFDALQISLEAEVNLLFGSADPTFMPSKLFALLAVGRPILAIAHAGSALAARMAELSQPCVLIGRVPANPADIQSVLAGLRAVRQSSGPIAPGSHSASFVAASQLKIFDAVTTA